MSPPPNKRSLLYCNVLIIENREFTHFPLRLGGWSDCNTQIQVIKSTAPALMLLHAGLPKPPNLVILAWQFPNGATSAATILYALKSKPEIQAVPVIALVRGASPEDIRDLYSDQCACVIELPDSSEETERILEITRELWLQSAILPYR